MNELVEKIIADTCAKQCEWHCGGVSDLWDAKGPKYTLLQIPGSFFSWYFEMKTNEGDTVVKFDKSQWNRIMSYARPKILSNEQALKAIT